jgi:hypothetical protein
MNENGTRTRGQRGLGQASLQLLEAVQESIAACAPITVRGVAYQLFNVYRLALLYLPTSCPRANPLERACGEVHDKCTRNHTRKRLWHLVQDVKEHLQVNGPWPYALSRLYYTPEVTAAVEALRAVESSREEISQLAA